MHYRDDTPMITLPSHKCNMKPWFKENMVSEQNATGVFSSKNIDIAYSLLLNEICRCPSLCIKLLHLCSRRDNTELYVNNCGENEFGKGDKERHDMPPRLHVSSLACAAL